MTIHVRAWAGNPDPFVPEDPTLQITITTKQDLLKLQQLLKRSLNCAPEFGKDWFELSDRLDQFLSRIN